MQGEMGPKGEPGISGNRGPTGRPGKRGKQVRCVGMWHSGLSVYQPNTWSNIEFLQQILMCKLFDF